MDRLPLFLDIVFAHTSNYIVEPIAGTIIWFKIQFAGLDGKGGGCIILLVCKQPPASDNTHISLACLELV